jgi:subtilisin family serine protease
LRYKYQILALFVFLLGSLPCFSQDDAWFYIRAKDTVFNPEFKMERGKMTYQGTDQALKRIFDKYEIKAFKKTYKKAKKEHLKRTFFVISDKKELCYDLLSYKPETFIFGEIINEEDKRIFEPNDYGLTSTIGDNIGLQANLDYLDFMEVPKAWYYTTGSPNTIIGIADARVDTSNIEFRSKTVALRKTSYSKGHGIGVASIAAAQGNNGYGIPGICYDCSIKTSGYGEFKTLSHAMELSRAGAKVVNCSWVGSKYYETAQLAINEMFENGTIIVAGAGNRSWKQTHGEKIYYPASYDHVISVSSVMYKHERVADNTLIADKGYPYASNIRGYVGRSVGFKDNDITKKEHIWPASTTTLNPFVDLLAPSAGVLRFSKYVEDNSIDYIQFEASSPSAPFVAGTIGLMYSLNPCLPADEVETILKFTSMNIDHIEANRPFSGNYGSGILNVGNAVEMVYKLYTSDEISIIEDQVFSRWDFKLTAFSRRVVIREQQFIDDATFDLKAKNRIVIGENTILRPNENGFISLKIDPDLEKECDLVLREGFMPD